VSRRVLAATVLVLATAPRGKPRARISGQAPVSKKRVWFDARTCLPIAMVSYDRRGEPYRSFDGAYSLYQSPGNTVMDGQHPYWSWTHVHVFDVQSGRMTRLEQVRSVRGGHTMSVNDTGIYDKYLTTAALMRLGEK